MQDVLTFISLPLFLKEGRRKLAFRPSEILFIEAADDFVKAVTAKEKFLLNYTMTDILCTLHPGVFVRVSRFYIVNLSHIRYVEGALINLGSFEIAIHKSYSKDFFKALLRRWDEE